MTSSSSSPSMASCPDGDPPDGRRDRRRASPRPSHDRGWRRGAPPSTRCSGRRRPCRDRSPRTARCDAGGVVAVRAKTGAEVSTITSRLPSHFSLRRDSSLLRFVASVRRYSAPRISDLATAAASRQTLSLRLASSDASSSSSSSFECRLSVSSRSCAARSTRPTGDRDGAAEAICRARRSASSCAAPGSTSLLTSPRSRAGVDRLTGEDGVHAAARPMAGEEPTGGGDQVAPDLREPERRTCRHHDVGGEDDLQTARGREAVDRDHDRLHAFADTNPANPPRSVSSVAAPSRSPGSP